MKFSPKRTGNPYQRGNITSYSATIATSKLKEAGFLLDDGTLIDFETEVESGKITLKIKETQEK